MAKSLLPISISSIYNGLGFKPINFTPATRTLPGGNTYQSLVPTSAPVVPATQAPVAQPVTQAPAIRPTAQAPVVQTSPVSNPTPSGPVPLDYSKYTDPATGKVMNPQEYADFLAKRVTGGSVPNYAGNALTQGPQTSAQLTSTATDLNNQRNDIAVGATDPYKAASKSGIAYSPSELAAIEKAYAGIYDPALKDVFQKLDTKTKEDAAALENKSKLEQMAQQHKYDLELKRTPTAAESNAAALYSSGTGPYVPGANPTVDAWTQRIYDGNAKITDIPASEKGLRNAVTVALNANGNQTDGKPTTSALGLQALQTAKDLLNKFDAGTGTNVVGASRLFGGGALGAMIPGTDQFNFSNDFNTLKSQLSLDAVKYLKGQGAVSDAERALLSSAVTKLNLAQTDGGNGDFRKTLQGIIDKLQGNAPDSSSGTVTTAPDGTLVEITD